MSWGSKGAVLSPRACQLWAIQSSGLLEPQFPPLQSGNHGDTDVAVVLTCVPGRRARRWSSIVAATCCRATQTPLQWQCVLRGAAGAPRPGSALSGWVTLSTPPSPCGLTLPDHLLHGENSVCPPHQGQPSPSTISHVDDISPRGGLPGRRKSREAHSLRGEGETWARNRRGKADVSRQDPCVGNRREAGQGGPFLVLVLGGASRRSRDADTSLSSGQQCSDSVRGSQRGRRWAMRRIWETGPKK